MKTVEVKWQDACSYAGWVESMSLVNWIEDGSRGICWSTGYLFAEDEDFVVLVGGMSHGMMRDAVKIPKSLIIEITEVKYVQEA